MAARVQTALSAIPSFYEELQVLGIIGEPAISTEGLRLVGAVLVAVLYAVHPLLGSVVAVGALALPVAMAHPVLARRYGYIPKRRTPEVSVSN